MNIRGKKFLVTGGAGFIGSHTTDALIAQGAKVVVVDDFSTGRKENVNPKARLYKLDIASPKLKAVFQKEKPAYVYHFAFNVQVPKSIEDPLMDARSILGSLNVIHACHTHKVRKVVFSSSGFLYGNNLKLPLTEREPVHPLSPYAVSKYAVENYLKYYRNVFGVPYVVLRYAAVYGPRQAMGAMADYIRQLMNRRQATMWGNGRKTRDYVFVGDVVKANLRALDVPDDVPDPLFNIGTGRETTLLTIYETIAKLLGREAKPVFVADRPGEQVRYALHSGKIRTALGWQPKVSLTEGLRETIRWHRSRAV